MISRAALRTRAKKADEDDFLYPCLPRGFNDVAGSFDVNSEKSLQVDFAVDTGTMRDSVASCKSACKLFRVIQVHREKLREWNSMNHWLGAIMAASDQDNLVAIGDKGARKVASDKTGAAGDRDSHGAPPLNAA